MANIKCQVDECYYNDNTNCCADSICIDSNGAEPCDCAANTACETFRRA